MKMLVCLFICLSVCLSVCSLSADTSERVIGAELNVADGNAITIGDDFVVETTVTNKSSKAR